MKERRVVKMPSSSFPILVALLFLISEVRGLENFRGSSGVIRGESGIKIGTGTSTRGSSTGRGNSGVRIGEGRNPNSTRLRILPSTTTTTTSLPYFRKPPSPQSSLSAKNESKIFLNVGMVVPYKSFGLREYTKAVTTAIHTLQKSTRGPRLALFNTYDFAVRIDTKELTPSPTDYVSLVLIVFVIGSFDGGDAQVVTNVRAEPGIVYPLLSPAKNASSMTWHITSEYPIEIVCEAFHVGESSTNCGNNSFMVVEGAGKGYDICGNHPFNYYTGGTVDVKFKRFVERTEAVFSCHYTTSAEYITIIAQNLARHKLEMRSYWSD